MTFSGRSLQMKLGLIGFAICVFAAAALASGSEDAAEAHMTHRMMLLVIQLGLILFAAKLGNIVFEKLKLPGVLGELVAGMVIGPYALGHLSLPGFADGLFPVPAGSGLGVSPELYGFSVVAAIVLLFCVGLETELKLLFRYALAGGLVGLGGVVFSFGVGVASAMLFSEIMFGSGLGFLAPECLFVGAITTATSVGITARILSERRKMDCPEGVTILSAAVIDDVLGIVILAAVMGSVAASRRAGTVDWGHVGIIAVKAVGVWLAATAVGLVASRKISFLLKWFGERTSIAVLALGLALVLGGLFEEAGLAMIIGAYVMGLSLSKADISLVVREKLSPIYALLVPVFFCVMGMQINFTVLASPPLLAFGAVYAVGAMLAKVVGCGLPALLAGFNLRGAARIGFGMAPRCEVALVIAGVGLVSGVLGAGILSAIIVMVLVNTLVAPPALMVLFRSPLRGTRKPLEREKTAGSVSFDFPSIEMAEFFVGKVEAVFESEGFFVHELRPEQRLYQLRKDGTVIDFQLDGTTLAFTCDPGDVPLIHAAMEEALAALEQAVRGLRKPFDAKAMRAGMLDNGPLGPATLRLKDFLKPALMVPSLRGSSKAEIIDELLEVLARNGLLKDIEAARRAVWEREASLSTGLEHGVAIPHGKTDAVDRLVCAVGVKPEGTDFDSLDGRPSRIFILTLSPKSKPAPHVQFMSTVSQVLNGTGRQRLLSCKNAGQMYAALTAPLAERPAPLPAPPTRPMPSAFDLAEYLKPELVEPDLRGPTKQEILRELVGLLEREGLLLDVQAATEAVLQREARLSTGMEAGLAIPHGRTNAVERLVCAVGVKRDGLDFGSADGEPTRIFVLVLTPETGADPYLQLVASVMAVLDADGRQRVLAARTKQQLFEALTPGATGPNRRL